MKKLIAILRKANSLTCKSTQEDQQFAKTMKTKFDEYRLPFQVGDDFAYFRSRIFYRGILTKERFEQRFEDTRNQLIEMWETMTYQERNLLLQLDLDPLKSEQPFLDTPNGKIWIPFFDDLLNSLYDHQIAIFELPQYFKLYRQFADKVLPLEERGLALWSAGFVDWIDLCADDQRCVFYYQPTHSLYTLDDTFQLTAYPLSKKPIVEESYERLIGMGSALLANDEIKFIRELLDSKLVDTKTKVRIGRYLKKEHSDAGVKA